MTHRWYIPRKYVAPVFMADGEKHPRLLEVVVWVNLRLNSWLPTWLLRWLDARPKPKKRR